MNNHKIAHETTDMNLLKKLILEDDSLRQNAAMNPNATSEILKILVKDDSEYVRLRVAKHPNIDSETLTKCLHDNNETVRGCALGNPKTNIDALLQHLDDDGEYIRYHIAENPNANIEILKTLAKDKDKNVRQRVAAHPNASSSLLHAFVKNEDRCTYKDVAMNPNTKTETLKLLLEKINKTRHLFYSTINKYYYHTSEEDEWFNDEEPDDYNNDDSDDNYDNTYDIKRCIINNPNVDEKILESIATDELLDIRRYIAGKPTLNVKLLEILAKDPDSYVRYRIAHHPNVTKDILHDLANDKDWAINTVANRIINHQTSPIFDSLQTHEILFTDKNEHKTLKVTLESVFYQISPIQQIKSLIKHVAFDDWWNSGYEFVDEYQTWKPYIEMTDDEDWSKEALYWWSLANSDVDEIIDEPHQAYIWQPYIHIKDIIPVEYTEENVIDMNDAMDIENDYDLLDFQWEKAYLIEDDILKPFVDYQGETIFKFQCKNPWKEALNKDD